MREILFRAKRIDNGEWVEGLPDYYDVTDKLGILHGRKCSWRVDYRTVSQFTGFYDKNGTRIFENDILETRYDEEHPEDSTKWKIIFVDGEWEMSGIEFYREKFEKLEQFDCDRGEVVGNIFDNEWEEP